MDASRKPIERVAERAAAAAAAAADRDVKSSGKLRHEVLLAEKARSGSHELGCRRRGCGRMPWSCRRPGEGGEDSAVDDGEAARSGGSCTSPRPRPVDCCSGFGCNQTLDESAKCSRAFH